MIQLNKQLDVQIDLELAKAIPVQLYAGSKNWNEKNA